MKLLDADKDKLVIEITAAEWDVISGMFSMINAQLPEPIWENSTGQADTAMTPEQFDAVEESWGDLLDSPMGQDFFVGKGK